MKLEELQNRKELQPIINKIRANKLKERIFADSVQANNKPFQPISTGLAAGGGLTGGTVLGNLLQKKTGLKGLPSIMAAAGGILMGSIKAYDSYKRYQDTKRARNIIAGFVGPKEIEYLKKIRKEESFE